MMAEGNVLMVNVNLVAPHVLLLVLNILTYLLVGCLSSANQYVTILLSAKDVT